MPFGILLASAEQPARQRARSVRGIRQAGLALLLSAGWLLVPCLSLAADMRPAIDPLCLDRPVQPDTEAMDASPPQHPALRSTGEAVQCLLPEGDPALMAPSQHPSPPDPSPSLVRQPSRGEQEAPVTILVFSDFACPFSARLASVLQEVRKTYADRVQVLFKHTPLPIHPQAPLVHEAALAAGEQGQFWAMHDRLFANQRRLEEADLLRYAAQLDLDMGAFQQALASHHYRAAVEQDLREALALGVSVTPTLFVNGQKLVGAQSLAMLKAIIEEELGLRPRRAERSASDAVVALSDLKIDQAPGRGAPNAPVTIVEFSDFQCPFCQKVLSVLDKVLTTYPHQVKWVFKHYPLDFHTDAPLAHVAALAAGEQGQFWAMHDRLFGQQRAMKRDDLLHLARELGLEQQQFAADLDNPKLRTRVEADKQDGERLRVTGTPTFFINGRRLTGARSLAEFEKVIEAELKLVSNGSQASVPKQAETPKAGLGAFSVAKGPQQASVQIEWFADLQSPLSLKAARLLEQLLELYPDHVRLVLKHRPLPFHAEAPLVHEAVIAAGVEGKFWEMTSLIVAQQQALTKEDLIWYAAQVGLDQQRFIEALEGRTYRPVVEKDLAEARKREVRGSPVFFVNALRVDGLQPLGHLQALIEQELKARPKPSP